MTSQVEVGTSEVGISRWPLSWSVCL